MKCGLCQALVDETRERHGTFIVPAASQVVNPEFEAWYKDMQRKYPCMERHHVFECLPSTYEIKVCLSCCVNLFQAAGLGWREFEALKKEAR